MAVLTMWDASRGFAANLGLTVCKKNAWVTENEFETNVTVTGVIGRHVKINVDELSWYEVKCQYKALKTLSGMINKIFGHILTCHIVKVILYYAISLNNIADWIKMVTVVLYFCGAFAILLFSADTCRNVRKINTA